jgi:transcriptional regulator GlxA family with amidase domain
MASTRKEAVLRDKMKVCGGRLMKVSIVVFDGFTDIDVFLPWDLLNRVNKPTWNVMLVGTKQTHSSVAGLVIPVTGHIRNVQESDAVVIASGPGTRQLVRDEQFLTELKLDPGKQLIGSMCSGALILGAKGLLHNKKATTYPSSKKLLEQYGVEVVERDFVNEGNISTAAGCLSALKLTGWIIERLVDSQTKDQVLQSVQPVGQGLSF